MDVKENPKKKKIGKRNALGRLVNANRDNQVTGTSVMKFHFKDDATYLVETERDGESRVETL